MLSQIPLPLETAPSLTREDFVVANGNRDALAFVESWPAWSVSAVAIHGPAASGKTHLSEIWIRSSGAQRVEAAALSGSAFGLLERSLPLVVEDVDASIPNPARDGALFDLIESATPRLPVLLTGRSEPQSWGFVLPDLGSRFRAMVSFSLWQPEEDLLRRLAHKLFEDRQLSVPDHTVEAMLSRAERSPAAIRDLVARADAKALAEGRAISAPLIRELLSEDSHDSPP